MLELLWHLLLNLKHICHNLLEIGRFLFKNVHLIQRAELYQILIDISHNLLIRANILENYLRDSFNLKSLLSHNIRHIQDILNFFYPSLNSSFSISYRPLFQTRLLGFLSFQILFFNILQLSLSVKQVLQFGPSLPSSFLLLL